jgi:hypothetical protein
VGRESGVESPVSHRTPTSAKVIIFMQTIVIMFLGYWAFEEYENNVYFQSYVNATVQANMLLLGGVLVGIPALTILGLIAKRKRSTGNRLVDVDESVQASAGSLGVLRQSGGETQGMSPLAAELSSRFLGQAVTTPSPPASQIVNRGGMPVLQRADQAGQVKAKPVEGGLPFLERIGPRPDQSEARPGVQNYEDSSTGRAAGFRPSPPNFPRPPDNPGVRRPPISAPLVRPSTVVTGVMGQGPRPFPPASPQPQASNRQGSASPAFGEKWEPGVRPTGPLGVQPPRSSQFAPPSGPAGIRPAPGVNPVSTVPPLGRVGPARSAADKNLGAEYSPSLGRVEPVQGVAKPSWPNNSPPSTRPVVSGPSLGEEQASKTGDDSFPDVSAADKIGQQAKRDEKRQVSGENSGS